MRCSPSCGPALCWPLLPKKLNLYPELRDSRSFPVWLKSQGCPRGAKGLGVQQGLHPSPLLQGEPTCPGTSPAPVCLQQSTRQRLD